MESPMVQPACMPVTTASWPSYKWQKPRMSFSLYSLSAAISMRLILNIDSNHPNSSSFVVVTSVEGGSHLCVSKGRTCKQLVRDRRHDAAKHHQEVKSQEET